MSYEAEIRDRACAMRADGHTLRAIAAALESNRQTICLLVWHVPHPNRRNRNRVSHAKIYPNCWQCGVEIHRSWGGRFCSACYRARAKHGGQSAAVVAVNKAVRAGILPPARGQQCTDCPRPAEEYDHRDYSKPLDVQPVCRRCNARRGPGKWVQFKPVRDLKLERQAA